MMMDKVMTLISFSRKAGKLVGGFDAVGKLHKEEKCKNCADISDASDRTRESVHRLSVDIQGFRIVNTGYTMEEYSKICKKSYAVLAIEDQGFAVPCYKLLEEELYDKKV